MNSETVPFRYVSAGLEETRSGSIEAKDFADAAAAAAQGYVQLTEFEVRALNRLPAAERPAALAKLRTSGNRKARRAAAATLRRGA